MNTKEFVDNFLGVLAIGLFIFIGGGFFLAVRAQVLNANEQRFATSTMSAAQIEEVMITENNIQGLIREQQLTNDLLEMIYNKL